MIVTSIIISLLLTLPSADAFTTCGRSSRAANKGRLTSYAPAAGSVCWKSRNANAAPAPSIRLFDQSPSSQSTTPMTSSDSNIFDQITTKVGKTASTLVSVGVFILVAYQRDAIILTIWIGSILNAVLSKVAKKILNHERPAELQNTEKIKLKPSDGGMPSSHAMSLGFVGTSITCGVVPLEYRLIAGVAMAAYSAIALRYRVRDHLHTVEQVAVGLLFGVGNALAWLKFGVGSGEAGTVLLYVQNHWVSAETGLFPYSALAIPIVVGILVVGSFERRIALWMENRGKED